VLITVSWLRRLVVLQIYTSITEEHAVTLFQITLPERAGIAVGTATGYMQDRRGSNPGGGRFLASVQTGAGDHPASFTVSFPGVKRPERYLNRTAPISAEVKESVELNL